MLTLSFGMCIHYNYYANEIVVCVCLYPLAYGDVFPVHTHTTTYLA